MINRIDIFIPARSQYGVLNQFTTDFAAALTRQGVNCRILKAERDNPRPFLDQIFQDPPNCTLSFNGLLPDEEGRFFCDLINIPHVAYLVDAPTLFFSLANSPLTIITCVDRLGSQFFTELESAQSFFLPHGVDQDLKDLHLEKKYEVVMFSSCIDYEKIRENWEQRFSKPLINALNEAIDVSLNQDGISYIHAFVQAVDKQAKQGNPIPSHEINFVEVLDMLERYIRGKDRVELVRNIRDAQVDVFGAPDESKSWSDYFKDMPNVRCHDPVPYQEAIQIMQQSKIVLSSCAWIKDGLHERILAGTQSGALVVCQENPYLLEEFPRDKSLLYYRHGQWDALNASIYHFLNHENERQDRVQQGQNIVQNGHTWDHRARQLLRDLNTYFSSE
ncbi:glycosyltransferase [Parachlamydia acanthamoebae]|uniref:glycosyltransferase family protein n=1 Tax=Parachlamydia acanthamoebae TaxID=83552 RepID=UPI0024E1D9ED|nr:glycosyltransferase [Parachlamydia acanthamoebae]